MRQDVQQREQHWVYFGKREGKANNSKRAILSTVGHTGQTHSRLWEKSSLQSPSISRQESQESRIPDTQSPFIGSWPLSQWFILENEHIHTWLIIFGKYLNNLGVRQERTKVVKSMLDGTKNGTGSRAMWVCDKELSKSLNLSGPRPPNQQIPFILQNGIKMSQTSTKCCGYSEKDSLCTHLCTSIYRTMNESLKKTYFEDNHHHCPHPWRGFRYYHWSHSRVSWQEQVRKT